MIEGITKKGTNEMVHLLKKIEPMVGMPGDTGTAGPKKIFLWKLVVLSYNFFFDDKSCDWIGKNGFGWIGMMARNALVNEIDKIYLHVEKHAPTQFCSNTICKTLQGLHHAKIVLKNILK